MYDEDDLLPISALQHLAFCERQCALIHVEGVWDENVLTAEGRQLHEHTHAAETATRAGVRIARSLRLQCLRLGLTGQADVVEFEPCDEHDPTGSELGGLAGRWRPFPVEYKRGKPKPDSSDEVQLCAQAICLEEMLDTTVPEGALFYGKTRRRSDVTFTPDLRRETERLAARLHELVAGGETPPARYEKKCRGCSLLDACLPKSAGAQRSAARYVDSLFRETEEGGAG